MTRQQLHIDNIHFSVFPAHLALKRTLTKTHLFLFCFKLNYMYLQVNFTLVILFPHLLVFMHSIHIKVLINQVKYA